ncbi:hypothetical protein [Crocinitomix catalasitica]|uniref:hypothetical protein n=1 Tax=Crocinitomix catalasitica TaxID=184607 RepID=UPI0006859AF2|nr:hypothetical protein [Crocinitomix catalasitica]
MKISSLILLSLFAVACGNQEDNSEAITENKTTVEPTITENTNPHQLVSVGEEKWIIDEGMRVSVDTIKMELEAFNGESLEEYAVLSDELAYQTKSIITNCTMKGEAHDELHKWLIPFINLRKELIGINDVQEGAVIVEQLKTEIVVFETYFK